MFAVSGWYVHLRGEEVQNGTKSTVPEGWSRWWFIRRNVQALLSSKFPDAFHHKVKSHVRTDISSVSGGDRVRLPAVPRVKGVFGSSVTPLLPEWKANEGRQSWQKEGGNREKIENAVLNSPPGSCPTQKYFLFVVWQASYIQRMLPGPNALHEVGNE